MDSILSLAYTMYSNKGVYSLLLGSGISRSAGIPTGWEIVLDLISKVAKLNGEKAGENPDEWYRRKYNKEPDYSELLNEIAKTPTERQMILKGYFEPTSEELEQGMKTPTIAHKAIANLVKNGLVKVIITTNFDRLMENALIEIGITPMVISNLDTLRGVIPIVHSSCTIIKVHGDYMDTRIKNTIDELENYDEEINLLLDKIFDEFGLITCGWSAEWDIALRNCLKRCKSHRFTTYWTSLNEPSLKAQELINIRRADIIKIKGADSFFKELDDKVMALEEIYKPHPLSIKVAVAMLKKYIVRPENKILLNDMIIEETLRVCDNLNSEKFDVNKERPTVELAKVRIKEYEATMDKLLHLVANGCYWGENEFKDIWSKCIEIIADTCKDNGGYTYWNSLRKYPVLLMIYVGGIASVASNKFYNLYSIINEANIKRISGFEKLIKEVIPYKVFEDKEWACKLLDKQGRYIPVSDYLHDIIKDILTDIIKLDDKYDYYFDYFEYFWGLAYIDNEYKEFKDTEDERVWCPIGRYIFKYEYNNRIGEIILKEAEKSGSSWHPLQAGYFNKEFDRYLKVKEKQDKFLSKAISNHF